MFEAKKATPFPAQLAWRTIPIPRDLPLSGWLAGPPVGVWVHHNGSVSKPCWRLLTDGELTCPLCAGRKRRLIGYVPLLTFKDQARRVVICSRTMLASVQELAAWTPVVCLTPKTKGLPAVIRASDEPVLKSSTHAKLLKRPPADIREYLLRVLWGVPELCAHFGTEVFTA